MLTRLRSSWKPPTLLVSKMIQPLWKTACQFLIKFKTHLPSDSTIALLCIYSREMRISIRDLTTNAHSSLVHSQNGKNPEVQQWVNG